LYYPLCSLQIIILFYSDHQSIIIFLLLDIHNTLTAPLGVPPSSEPSDARQIRNLEYSNNDILSILYHSTGGADWTSNNNWMDRAVCPSGYWQGIDCAGYEVINIVLNQNSLRGTLPSQLGLLTGSSIFDMSANEIFGTVPSELGLLTALYAFEVHSNSNLTGTIPSEIGQMTRLQLLWMNSAQFSGSVPSQLGKFTFLTRQLYLYSNNLCDDIPSELAALSSQVEDFVVTNGTSLGTPCCILGLGNLDRCQPTSAPTSGESKRPTLSPTLFPTSVPTSLPTITCLSGTYFNGATCVTCIGGTYSDFNRTKNPGPYPDSCTQCAAGQYNPLSGQSACTVCSPGKLSSPDRTYCKDCGAGEYSLNNSECVGCEVGKYAPQALSGSCLTCPAGSHTNNKTKSTTCTPCDSGKYSSQPGDECLDCSVGQYSASGQSKCTECEAGKYSSSSGSSTCYGCDVGTWSSEGSASCPLAAIGYYLKYPNMIQKPCPHHCICEGDE
jgi:hypothetical protein